MAEAAETENKQEETLVSSAVDKVNEEVTEDTGEGISHTENPEEETLGVDEDELEFKKPDYLADKFWDDEEGPRIEEMSKSLGELEKKLSQGEHKKPDEYDTKILDEYDIDVNDEVVQGFLQTAGDAGLNQASVNSILKTFLESNAQFLEKNQAHVEEEKRKLGGKADDIIDDAVRFGSSLLNKGVFSEEGHQEYLKTCNTAQGIKMIRAMRDYYGEGKMPAIAPNDDIGMSEEEVRAQVNDPRYQTDPSFRAKVEKDFNRVFPGMHQE